ncbi:zinc-binding dehydrogenase [Embleya scabrispora]|uniref:zinc-binding dehydrogenase n=1 Tax=Embleya scabrispora TaxID=159449 RepID=UPI00037373EE|nr:zinc-binding dehydrogenase [Embleya scabrispora]MYS86894.1 zinc-binding dehydrogenase [Streptomyces sp. SID5474]
MSRAIVFVQAVRATRNAEQLGALAALFEKYLLRIETAREVAPADAAEAHREIETGHVRGKVVLTVD